MTKDIFRFLKNYSTDTVVVNRLIVSSYVNINRLKILKNSLLKKHIITDSSKKEAKALADFNKLILKYEHGFRLENVIELFEFVISPSDKTVNGAIYTPNYIREFIVNGVVAKYTRESLNSLTCADISCGCGGFLLDIARLLSQRTNRKYSQIYKDNIFGIDITAYSIERAKLLLTLNAVENGEDEKEFKFNFVVDNALAFNRTKRFPQTGNGFDVVVGNPPYVCSRNMDNDSLRLLENWSVTKSGHPDLYIPFFQIGAENLKSNGILGFITVNTFFKSINGRALRKYFEDKQLHLRIINFGGEQVFNSRNTYTCICLLQNTGVGAIEYTLTESRSISNLTPKDFNRFFYTDLNSYEGWNLVSSNNANDFVKKVEATGFSFKSKFVTRNGIATLKNNIYKFTPFKTDKSFYYINVEDTVHKIEKSICKDVVNSNKIKTTKDINNVREKIIFPYRQDGGDTALISEIEFKKNYPSAYAYLSSFKKVLAKRDKGKKEYGAWYAYGRKQSLDINAYKLFFPHICERPTFVLCREKDLLFYNGIAVVSNDIEELKLLKIVLESDVFFQYLKHTTKNYSSGYISVSRNYIKNFGIPKFNENEKSRLLKASNLSEINAQLDKFYPPIPQTSSSVQSRDQSKSTPTRELEHSLA